MCFALFALSAAMQLTLVTPIARVTNINKHNKNVLMVIVDDLRPALGCYGDTKAITPNMDRLAAQGIRFTHAYAQQSLCAPSRNSMLTSRRPDTLHLYDFNSYWRTSAGNFTTLPQHLRRNGYATYSIGKVFHPGSSSNNTDDYPYSWTELPYHSPAEKFMNRPVCPDIITGKLEKNVICPVHVADQPLATLPDIESMAKAKEIIANHVNSSTKPYFMAVGFHKPHIPLRFPDRYLRLHDAQKFQLPEFNYVPYDMPAVAFNPYTDIRSRTDATRQNITFPYGPMPHLFGVSLRQAYYAAVTYVDDVIGELLAAVDFDNTIVVLTGDHGWSLGEHAEWAKYSNFEVAVRVPLIIRQPNGRSARHSVQRNVELLDLFPTIVELAGVVPLVECGKNSKRLKCVEGKSLVPLMDNDNDIPTESVAFSQYPRPSAMPTAKSDRPTLRHIQIMGYSIRTTNFRYTAWIGFNNHNFHRDWNRIFGEELYDHRFDADENINLVNRKELNTIRTTLKKQLRRQFR